MYSIFRNRKNTYTVEAIFTNNQHRNKGSAKRLLKNLSFFGDLYFDTYTEPLIHLLNNIKAIKEDVIKGKSSTQFILRINNDIS